jgi:hypothetical protein
MAGRELHDPPEKVLLIFYVDHFAAFIKTAVGAYSVRQSHFTAVAALNQIA